MSIPCLSPLCHPCLSEIPPISSFQDFSAPLRLASFNYTGTNPIANGYIRGIQSGSNTLIQVDADGVGSSATFSTLVTLNNFTASNFSQSNLIF
ncbi:hypothetical protein [Aulosira sp. FACHB-615]|uniref:hypothetical protein n=1 Tax=Aulosira sp. FACHB-615 TaxID=2692777 RepID=UPI001687A5C6|nr:hypothetical protein [Aulosira sp. FACHB-615]MBD2491347.1 hypothetical protein [Aulosira sp. FACHB-615]